MAGAMFRTSGEHDGDTLRIAMLCTRRKADAAPPWRDGAGRQIEAARDGVDAYGQRRVTIDRYFTRRQIKPGHHRIGRWFIAAVATRHRRLGQCTAGKKHYQDRRDRWDRHVQRISDAN